MRGRAASRGHSSRLLRDNCNRDILVLGLDLGHHKLLAGEAACNAACTFETRYPVRCMGLGQGSSIPEAAQSGTNWSPTASAVSVGSPPNRRAPVPPLGFAPLVVLGSCGAGLSLPLLASENQSPPSPAPVLKGPTIRLDSLVTSMPITEFYPKPLKLILRPPCCTGGPLTAH
jgi:hypothetical protein